MRKSLTPPEARLRQALRGHRLDGLKFRRQHPIGPFILDFYCVSARLAVEIDGAAHTLGDGPRRDESRHLWLERHRAADRGAAFARAPGRGADADWARGGYD
jgi:very-short-patch-repair endonuclease